VSAAHTPTRLYFADKIPEIDVQAVAYFAMSIFWRGAIHPWNNDGTLPVPLGPFQEEFRQYLMGMRPFPKECAALWAVIREGKEIDRLTYGPTGNRIGKLHSYRFPMPGFCFILFAGKNIPAALAEKCFAAGVGNPIVVTSFLEPMLLREAVKMRSKSLSVKN
jgi:hypothetical protein